MSVRIAVVTESFLPQVNGVTNSVLRVCEHLSARNHELLVVAPGPGVTAWGDVPVVRSPSIPLPGYPGFRVSRPWSGLAAELRQFRPDVIHLASPAVLGAQACRLADRLAVPAVAVYQTDLAGFATRYGWQRTERVVWRWLREVHKRAARTLAPSRAAVDDLRRHGIGRVRRWGRGVDLERFSPAHRDDELRRRLAPGGELLVGYVGRLAAEKEVELLAALGGLPGVRLVLAGDGPCRAELQRRLPFATFLGFTSGAELSALFASLDVFVHPGAHETFCQAAQEALASGVPVVGPAAGGLLDLVEHGHTGRWFEPGSGSSLRHAVTQLTDDPQRLPGMAEAARRSVAGRSWASIGDELLDHYDEVLTGAAGVTAR